MKRTTDLIGLLAERSRRKTTRKVKPIVESEADIQNRIRDWLERVEGWRGLNTDPRRARGMGVAEKGIADDLYIRYGCRPFAKVFWLEAKRKQGRAGDDQLTWHIAERARGALTCIMGYDCEATEKGFMEWYKTKGLGEK